MDFTKLFRLDGRMALVTGSAQGLGKEIAVSLAQNGASLILADIVYPEETAKEIENIGSRYISIKTDISDETEVKNLAKKSPFWWKGLASLGNFATQNRICRLGQLKKG